MTCTTRTTPGCTHYCAKTRQPCVTPWTCSPVCKLITANSDGSDPHKPQTTSRPTLRWVVVLIVSTALAGYCVLHAPF